MTYEILDHTADVGFRAKGETLAEAFESATRAFAEIVSYENPPEATDEVRVEVEAEDAEALLFDYLDRLIYTQDVEGVVVVDAEVEADEDALRLDATLHVAPIQRGYMDIKAPTYSEMVAEKDDGECVLEAVLDI
ncbi:MAG: archease [Halobacteriales archaeon]|nr:archease [Halobacteriales archaeon]